MERRRRKTKNKVQMIAMPTKLYVAMSTRNYELGKKHGIEYAISKLGKIFKK